MRPDRYAVIYRWFAARPAALTALRLANRWLPLASAGAYALLLALLAVRLAAGAGDMGLLARAVLVPGAVFGGGSVLRAVLNRPRPYQQPGFVPLLPKETLGRSFPSRHALSAAVIAAAWLPVSPAVCAILAVLALALCAARVLAGVHTPADVLAGAALGFALGALGMCAPWPA